MMARTLAVIERDAGAERLIVAAQASGNVEVSEEIPTLTGWRLRRRVVVRRNEIARILNALLEALKSDGAPATDLTP